MQPLDDDAALVALIESRDNIIRQIQDVTSKPRPDYEIDGQKVKWGAYLKQLQDALKAQNDLIQEFDGPFETHSTMYP
jgi:hypothetical protein